MKRVIGGIILGVIVLLTGCSGSGDKALIVYSGRSEPLMKELVERYKEKVDIPVKVKYGRDAQLLAALREEGDQTPADIYLANTTGALSNAVQNDMLSKLPDSMLDRAHRFVPSNEMWVPISARFRVLAYNPNRVDPSILPDSVLDLPSESRFKRKIGWTPTYSSFQDFVTGLRILEGPETTRRWLNGMQALEPKAYTSNTPMVRAIAAGEIDVALTNHYYVLRLKYGGPEGEYEEEEEEEHEEEEEMEPTPGAPVKMYRFKQGDPGNLALVTGAGILTQSDRKKQARKFLKFLLSKKSQSFVAHKVKEYPVVTGTTVPEYMLPVEKALSLSPDFDPGRLGELDTTLEMLRKEGIF